MRYSEVVFKDSSAILTGQMRNFASQIACTAITAIASLSTQSHNCRNVSLLSAKNVEDEKIISRLFIQIYEPKIKLTDLNYLFLSLYLNTTISFIATRCCSIPVSEKPHFSMTLFPVK